MHLGCFRVARFAEKVLGAFSRFLSPKTDLYALKFRCIFNVFTLTLHALYKCSEHIFTIYASKNEAVYCDIQTHL